MNSILEAPRMDERRFGLYRLLVDPQLCPSNDLKQLLQSSIATCQFNGRENNHTRIISFSEMITRE
jgi:hypothetical protein